MQIVQQKFTFAFLRATHSAFAIIMFPTKLIFLPGTETALPHWRRLNRPALIELFHGRVYESLLREPVRSCRGTLPALCDLIGSLDYIRSNRQVIVLSHTQSRLLDSFGSQFACVIASDHAQ